MWWGGWLFGANGVQGTLTEGAVEDARGAAYAVWWVVWDGHDGWIVWYVRKCGGKSVMFESPGQSWRPTLQANAVMGPSPWQRPRSRSVSPSRGGVPICRRKVEVLQQEMGTRALGEGEVGIVLEGRW